MHKGYTLFDKILAGNSRWEYLEYENDQQGKDLSNEK